MKRLLKLFLALLISCFNNAFAQQHIDIKATIYDEVIAARASKKSADYRLRGKVKSMTEISLTGKDTAYFEFNPSGLLLSSRNTGSSKLSVPKTTTLYTYENNQLKKIRTELPNHRISEKYYGASGYLEKQINDYVDYEEKFHQESFYSYSNIFHNLKINYQYKNESNNWDLVISDTYDFTFDSKNRLTKIRNKSKHSEATYGSTSTFSYDTLSGRLIHASLIDDCAGSNSCLILNLSMDYDPWGHVIYESMTDQTIRNSVWSYGYTYMAKYNEQHDITEEYRSRSENSYSIQPFGSGLKKQPQDYQRLKKLYAYDYDSRGNWTHKYLLADSKRELIIYRTIEYFE